MKTDNTNVSKVESIFAPHVTITGNDIFIKSDERIKTNIIDMDLSYCDKVMDLRPRTFTLVSDITSKKRMGFIAQEIEEVFPSLVCNYCNDETKSVNYLELIPVLLLKIQDLQKQIDELKK